MITELLDLRDALNDVLRLIDEAAEVASMMQIAGLHADIEPATAASAVARILGLAQAQGNVAAKLAAGLHRQASKSNR